MSAPPTPKELDAQSPVRIDAWLDINSEECREKSQDDGLAKKWLRQQMNAGFLFLDSDGRVWGKYRSQPGYYPYHFNVGKTLYGYRVAKHASN